MLMKDEKLDFDVVNKVIANVAIKLRLLIFVFVKIKNSSTK